MLKAGGDTWFFIQADYTFGATLAAEATAVIEAGGGKVLGAVKHPFPGTTDFSSYLLTAQASGAKVIGLANAGTDAANCVKQAGEFGITQAGQRLATLQCLMPQIHGVGVAAAQGLFQHRIVLLGPERRHPRLVELLVGADGRQSARA